MTNIHFLFNSLLLKLSYPSQKSTPITIKETHYYFGQNIHSAATCRIYYNLNYCCLLSLIKTLSYKTFVYESKLAFYKSFGNSQGNTVKERLEFASICLG